MVRFGLFVGQHPNPLRVVVGQLANLLLLLVDRHIVLVVVELDLFLLLVFYGPFVRFAK